MFSYWLCLPVLCSIYLGVQWQEYIKEGNYIERYGWIGRTHIRADSDNFCRMVNGPEVSGYGRRILFQEYLKRYYPEIILYGVIAGLTVFVLVAVATPFIRTAEMENPTTIGNSTYFICEGQLCEAIKTDGNTAKGYWNLDSDNYLTQYYINKLGEE